MEECDAELLECSLDLRMVAAETRLNLAEQHSHGRTPWVDAAGDKDVRRLQTEFGVNLQPRRLRRARRSGRPSSHPPGLGLELDTHENLQSLQTNQPLHCECSSGDTTKIGPTYYCQVFMKRFVWQKWNTIFCLFLSFMK